ncbi:DUF5362 family protein [Bacteroidota bacterium]
MNGQNISSNQPIHPDAQIFDFQSTVIKMSRDMKFLAVIAIIYGVICCLSIIGALFGVPYIIAGIRLKEAASHFFNYGKVNNIAELELAIERQQRFFFIFKVLVIIGVIITVTIIIVYIIFIGIFLSNGLNLFETWNDMAFMK